MFVVIDSGSSATRIYLLKFSDTRVIDKVIITEGVNSTLTSGSRDILRQSMANGVKQLLARNGLAENDIAFIIASGMITSNLGLHEVPHRIAPASIAELAQHTVKFAENELLALSIPVILIPGIKNDTTPSWANLRGIDLMRGEETQAAGILLGYQPRLPCTLIELGSTTKLISINEQGQIAGSITSLSGQIYAAIVKQTFVSSSVTTSAEEPAEEIDRDIIDAACRSVADSGFLRTVLMTRFLQFSFPTTASQRKLFLESAMAGDDVKLFADAQQQGFNFDGDVFLIGNARRCEIYQHVIQQQLNIDNPLRIISDEEQIDLLAITGASAIANILHTLQ
ncbi:2-dehydro-3-deoxygalactonokinase [Enterobacter sp. MYb186]